MTLFLFFFFGIPEINVLISVERSHRNEIRIENKTHMFLELIVDIAVFAVVVTDILLVI